MDEIKFIVLFRTMPLEAALRALGSKEAAKVRVALRLGRRLSTILYKLAERAAYLEAMGVERSEATRELAEEYRLRMEERLRSVRSAMDFAVFAIAMIYLSSAITSILSIISPVGAQFSLALFSIAVGALAMLEQYVRPVRKWDYRVAALASIPAVLSWFPPFAVLAAATAVLYGAYYFKAVKEAEEEVLLAARGKLSVASTDQAKAAAEIMKAVKESGALDLQATAEFLLRMNMQFAEAIRRAALFRALAVVATYVVLAAAMWQLTSIVNPLVASLEQQGLPSSISVSPISARPILYVAGLVAMLIAGRMTESYAAVPIYSPLMLTMLIF